MYEITDPPSRKYEALFDALNSHQFKFPDAFDQVIYERGVFLYKDTRVAPVEIKSYSPRLITLRAFVQGSKRYSVDARLELSVDDIQSSTLCTCPYSYMCKHGAALLEAFFSDDWPRRIHERLSKDSQVGKALSKQKEPASPQNSDKEVTQQPLSKEFDASLRRLLQNERPLPPHRIISRYEVGYALSVEKLRSGESLAEWRVEPIVIQPSEQGRRIVGSTSQQFLEFSQAGGINCHPEDTTLLVGLGAMSIRRPSYASYESRYDQRTCTRGDLLVSAVSTGRCFIDRNYQPLSIGEDIEVVLGWAPYAKQKRATTILGMPSTAVALQSSSTFIYVDIKRNIVGKIIVAQQAPPLAEWLNLPKVKEEQGVSLVATLRSRGLPTAGLEDIEHNHEIPEILKPQVVITVRKTDEVYHPNPHSLGRTYTEKIGPILQSREEPVFIHTVALSFRYGSLEIGSDSSVKVIVDPNSADKKILRNQDYEQAVLDTLRYAGLIKHGHSGSKDFDGLFVIDTRYQEYLFGLLNCVMALEELAKKEGWEVHIPPELFPTLINSDGLFGRFADLEFSDWFDCELLIDVGGREIDFSALLLELLKNGGLELAALRTRKNEYVTIYLNGSMIQLERERVVRIAEVVQELSSHESKKSLRFNKYSGYAFENALRSSVGRWESPKQIVALRQRVAQLEERRALPEPSGFVGQLRGYQHDGVAWLQTLCQAELGGVLADDMGLGKTVQLIALILHEREKGRTAPNLVVCPKSVAPNWVAELKRFAPKLTVRKAFGDERFRGGDSNISADVVITTYSLLLRDVEFVEEHLFNVAIFDEAQAIKNPITASYHAARRVKARVKFPVSGTPLENNLQDLWAHFNLTMPGFLYDRDSFKRVYRIPIEKHGSQELREHLAVRIKPFILRRTKQEVAKDLPPLTEIVQRCPLEGEQLELYETIRQLTQTKVQDALRKKGAARSHIEFLDALLKLRQVCCDPRLVKVAAAKKVKRSAKLELLLSLIEEMVDAGRSIVVFSQFTSMLALIEGEIVKRGIPYCLLTGESEDREAPVRTFQSGEVRLFLMSLKAGGVGLNLTAADTVVIYDPWWNPAVESQAICRAHRIGQSKPVFAYRLIAEGTVEEKILHLQARKRALVEDLLEEAERPPELTSELIDYLFAPLDAVL